MTNEIIKKAASEFCTSFNIKVGWSQEQHVGFQHRMVCDMLGLESEDDKKELLSILALTCNPSAFRQKLENAEVLDKVDKGTKSSSLANKYAYQQSV